MTWQEIKQVITYTILAVMAVCVGGGVILMLSGCSTYVFKLQNGEVVYCKDVIYECMNGISLYRCDDGKQYLCQSNIAEIADSKMRKKALQMREEEKKREIELGPFYIYPFAKSEGGI